MSFDIINLTPLQNGKNRVVPTLWTYYNRDNDDISILNNNYFNKECGLKNNDILIIIGQNSSNKSWYRVEVNSTNYVISIVRIEEAP